MDIEKVFAELDATKKKWLEEEKRHETQIKEWRSQVEQTKAWASSKIAEVKHAVAMEITSITSQLEPLRAELGGLRQQVATERDKLTTLIENEKQDFHSTRAELRAELDSLQAQIEEKQRILGAVTKDLAELAAKHF